MNDNKRILELNKEIDDITKDIGRDFRKIQKYARILGLVIAFAITIISVTLAIGLIAYVVKMF